MLLQESRRPARETQSGDLVLLEHQNRALWNANMIAEGTRLVEEGIATRQFGPYCLQAAIAAVHAGATTAAETDWAQIIALYEVLLTLAPSPVVELNRAVAIAMRDGPNVGLQLVDAIFSRGELNDYHLLHAARADFCRRLNRFAEARAAYARALQLAQQEPERRFLKKRLEAIENNH